MMKAESESRNSPFVERAAGLLLMFYPSLMFGIKGGMNAIFLLLLLLSITFLAQRSRKISYVACNKEMILYSLAMTALPFAVFLSQSYHQHYSGHPYDAASRFVLAVPIFMLLRQMSFRVISMVQYGFPIAAIVGCLMIKQVEVGRLGISTMDVIHFGDFELVLGVLSVFSISWAGRDRFWLCSLKLAGLLAGIYASTVSGSRGGWVALPIFLVIYIYFRYGKMSLKVVMGASLMLLLSGIVSYTCSQTIHFRVDQAMNDLRSFHHGNLDTSTGMRLQIYQAALRLVVQNPVFGVGPEGFALEMDVMREAGEMTPLAAAAGKGEVHNELLSKTAGMGVFGLAAVLSIYLVPARAFCRAMKSRSAPVRQSGMLGLVFVSGFMIFGLTVEVLNLTMATAFYSLTVAVFLACCLKSSAAGGYTSP